MTDVIRIDGLEVFYRVGVPDQERATPQRLLLYIDMAADLAKAAATDDLRHTIDYAAVTQWLLQLGRNREWRLIESLADEIAAHLLEHFGARSVTVEVRKFILPETRHVAVQIHRAAPDSPKSASRSSV